MEDKIQALANHLALDDEDINDIIHIQDNLFKCYQEEYLILTDDEADDALKDYIDSLYQEDVIPRIPDDLQPYFKYKTWFFDKESQLERGVLSSYNDIEENEVVDGVTYYIYRLN